MLSLTTYTTNQCVIIAFMVITYFFIINKIKKNKKKILYLVRH